MESDELAAATPAFAAALPSVIGDGDVVRAGRKLPPVRIEPQSPEDFVGALAAPVITRPEGIGNL